ncbi:MULTISPECIES: hypothetical protein [Gordonia]|jgi:hypothetical protein|uniref:hypothetical protein n=1 Tax=Gordonia TaxID=2053 RepID=UPI0032B3D96A
MYPNPFGEPPPEHRGTGYPAAPQQGFTQSGMPQPGAPWPSTPQPGAAGHNPFAPPPYPADPNPYAANPATGNPYAANPYGQPPPTASPPAVRPRLTRPPTVVAATALLVLAAVLVVVQVVAGSIAIARVDRAVDAASLADPTDTTAWAGDWIDTGQTWAIVLAALLGLAFVATYLAFAYAAWSARSWPRFAALVLAAFSLFGLLGGPITIAIVVVGVAATVLLWVPPSRHYASPYTPPPPDPFRG